MTLTDTLHIDFFGAINDDMKVSYDLHDIAGKVLASGGFNQRNNILTVDAYAAGTYTLRLWSEGSMESYLIIKEQ